MPRRSALVAVDVQHDFAHPAGALYVAGADRLLPRIDALMTAARARGDLVVTTQDWHPVGHGSFAATHGLPPFTVRDGAMTWPVHCVAGTWGAELVAGLDVANIDHRVLKGVDPGIESYSGFGGRERSSTGAGRTLEKLLWDADVEELDVARRNKVLSTDTSNRTMNRIKVAVGSGKAAIPGRLNVELRADERVIVLDDEPVAGRRLLTTVCDQGMLSDGEDDRRAVAAAEHMLAETFPSRLLSPRRSAAVEAAIQEVEERFLAQVGVPRS